MSLPVFPSTGAIPPATFYTLNGLSGWLNGHPTYKQYFVGFPAYFPYLYTQSTINEFISTEQIPASSIYANYRIEEVPLSPLVTTLNQYQAMQHREQLDLFLRVYTYNSNAYVSSFVMGRGPVYYRFGSQSERVLYQASVRLINKLYPFDVMRQATNEAGSTLRWIVPFPL